eukprot:scaffold43269_cov24-Tisochrysis_lutea.AAC.3
MHAPVNFVQLKTRGVAWCELSGACNGCHALHDEGTGSACSKPAGVECQGTCASHCVHILADTILLQWGAVEREPRAYNWSGYKQLFEVIKKTGLKAQVRTSSAQQSALNREPSAKCLKMESKVPGAMPRPIFISAYLKAALAAKGTSGFRNAFWGD